MSLYFIANNLHFAFELLGALAFLVMGWLAIDAYMVSKHYSSLLRVVGFFLVGIWQVIHAFNFGGDVVNIFGFSTYLLGLAILTLSFISTPRMAAVSAVLLIPSFSGLMPFFQVAAAILLAVISFLCFRQAKREFNASLRPLWIGFLCLTIAAFMQIIPSADSSDNLLWYVAHAFEVISFISFAFWVWQYLKLRVRESLILIFISMTLFIATIVTLAFSTILISKVEQQTRSNLLIDAKVFDFSVRSLSDQAGAEAKLISIDPSVTAAVAAGNILNLQTTLSRYLDTENLGFLLATDQSGTVLMRAHSPSERGDSVASERAVEEALVGNNFTTIESSPAEKFSIRASAPVYKDGKVIGAIIAGFPLDNAMVDGIKKITGLDTTLYQADKAIATTSLAADGRSRLTGVSLVDTAVKESVLARGETATARVIIKDTPFLASYLPIKNGDNKIVGMFSAAKPQADILDIANSTNRLTLVTVTIILLLLAFPVYALTRRLLESTL